VFDTTNIVSKASCTGILAGNANLQIAVAQPAAAGRLAFPGFKGILVIVCDAVQPKDFHLRLIQGGTIVEENRNEFCAT
jgi:hypothetical protein